MDQPPKTTTEGTEKGSKAEQFVSYVIERIKQDNGFAARLKRADNPATEYQSWEFLARFGVDLEKPWQRLPYCIVGAALARAKPETNGQLPLGVAIGACFDDGNKSDQAKARMRRLLACTSTAECCRILRPLLALMASRGKTPNFIQILDQLQWYSGNGLEKVRARWAQDFYRRVDEDKATESAHD